MCSLKEVLIKFRVSLNTRPEIKKKKKKKDSLFLNVVTVGKLLSDYR